MFNLNQLSIGVRYICRKQNFKLPEVHSQTYKFNGNESAVVY